LSLKKFIGSEFRDRLKNKHFTSLTWNFIFFPITVAINYRSYKKWIKTLNHLELTLNDLGDLVRISLSIEKMSLFEKAQITHEINIPEKTNKGYVINTDKLIAIFPIYSQDNKNHFFTKIETPIIICTKDIVHPYRTILNLLTFDNIIKIENSKPQTLFMVKDRTYNKTIELIIYKELELPNSLK